jgi:hypothetical protein
MLVMQAATNARLGESLVYVAYIFYENGVALLQPDLGLQ